MFNPQAILRRKMKNSMYSQVDSFNSVKSGPDMLGCNYSEESNFTLYEPGKKAKPRKKRLFKR